MSKDVRPAACGSGPPYTLVLTHDVDHLSMRSVPVLSRTSPAWMTDEYSARGAGAITFWANRTNRYGGMLLAAARGLGFFTRKARSSFVVKDIADSGRPRTDPGRWLLSALWFEGYAV